MADQWPRHAQITATDRGPLVNIASWTLAVTTVLFTSFRLLSNTVLRGAVSKDDWIICVTTLLAIAQTIATSSMVKNGIGQHQDTLSGSTIARFQQVGRCQPARETLHCSPLTIAVNSCGLCSLCRHARFQQVLLALLPEPSDLSRDSEDVQAADEGNVGNHASLSCKDQPSNCVPVAKKPQVSEVLILSFGCNLPRVYDFTGGRCIDLVSPFAIWFMFTAVQLTLTTLFSWLSGTSTPFSTWSAVLLSSHSPLSLSSRFRWQPARNSRPYRLSLFRFQPVPLPLFGWSTCTERSTLKTPPGQPWIGRFGQPSICILMLLRPTFHASRSSSTVCSHVVKSKYALLMLPCRVSIDTLPQRSRNTSGQLQPNRLLQRPFTKQRSQSEQRQEQATQHTQQRGKNSGG